MRIAFIGLGNMGRHMAANLQKAGHEVVVHDMRPAAAESHLANGATWANSAAEAAQGAELILTSLPGPKQVEEVALGEGGILQGAAKGAVYADLSTSSPTLIRRIYGVFAEQGIHVLDAPVSGGPNGAERATLQVMVGGDEEVYDRVRPALLGIGDKVSYVGEIGAGEIAKLCHNTMSYCANLALAEIFTLGVKAGVEPLALFKALRQGATGRKRTFDRLPEHFLPGVYDPPAFTVRLAHKDMALAMELAAQEGVPMKIGQVALDELAAAIERGWSERDCRVAMTLQEERAEVSVRVPRERLQDAMD